jgi:hypothetical protein
MSDKVEAEIQITFRQTGKPDLHATVRFPEGEPRNTVYDAIDLLTDSLKSKVSELTSNE